MNGRELIQRALSEAVWPNPRTQIPQCRIEVNFKCGKLCFYCRPTGEGISIDGLKDAVGGPVREMAVDEIIAIAKVLTRHGVIDFKLTGGDPMLRPDIVEIVRQLKGVPGLASLHLVTRHHRAGELAEELKKAGLDLLNFSLDSLDAQTWTNITRVRGHEQLVSAVRAASRTGIPIKLNTVVLKGVNNHEIPDLIKFAGEIGAELKLLDLISDIGMFPGFERSFVKRYYMDLVPVAEWLAAQAEAVEVVTQAGGLGHPMLSFTMPSGAIVTIKSARFGAYYGSVCSGCPFFPCWDALMALRVTPNGMLQFCLLRGDNLVNLLALLQRPNSEEADAAVARAVEVYRAAIPYTGDAVAYMQANARARAEARRSLQPVSVLNLRS